jgi:hypothetical protein
MAWHTAAARWQGHWGAGRVVWCPRGTPRRDFPLRLKPLRTGTRPGGTGGRQALRSAVPRHARVHEEHGGASTGCGVPVDARPHGSASCLISGPHGAARFGRCACRVSPGGWGVAGHAQDGRAVRFAVRCSGEATPRGGDWTVHPSDHRVVSPTGTLRAGLAVSPTLRHHARPPPARGGDLYARARAPQTALRASRDARPGEAATSPRGRFATPARGSSRRTGPWGGGARRATCGWGRGGWRKGPIVL